MANFTFNYVRISCDQTMQSINLQWLVNIGLHVVGLVFFMHRKSEQAYFLQSCQTLTLSYSHALYNQDREIHSLWKDWFDKWQKLTSTSFRYHFRDSKFMIDVKNMSWNIQFTGSKITFLVKKKKGSVCIFIEIKEINTVLFPYFNAFNN